MISLRILEMWCNDYPNDLIAKILEVSNKTIVKCLKAFLKKIVNNYYLSIYKIEGNKCIVEVEESKFGRRKYNKGHFVDGTWILGMVERSENRKIILIPIINFKKENIHRLLRFYIFNDTRIYTDGFKSYRGLEDYFIEHQFVNHKKEYKVKNTDIHTNILKLIGRF